MIALRSPQLGSMYTERDVFLLADELPWIKVVGALTVASLSFYGYHRNKSIAESLSWGGIGAVSIAAIVATIGSMIPGGY